MIYESNTCPYQRIDLDWGLDSLRSGVGAPLGPDSELVCKTFPASPTAQTLTVDLIVGGVEHGDRGNSIWTISGNGALPTDSITPDSGGNPHPTATEIVDPLNANRGAELDIASITIPVGAGDTYACYQIEAKETEIDPFGISGVLMGALTSWPMEAPSIDIQKTPDLQTTVSGSPVTFTIRVENTGPVTLNNVTVTDPQAPNCTMDIGTLEPESIVLYDCRLNDVTARFTNVATVNAQPPYGAALEESDSAVVEVINPAIAISKTPDSQIVEAGSPVTFTISVQNSGDITLTNVLVTDALVPACDMDLGTLAPDVSASYRCILDEADQSFTNVASVVGLPPVGSTVQAVDSAEVAVINPAISIAKTPDTQTVEQGGAVSFTIVVENRGDAALTNVTVTDPLTPNCDNVIGTLDIGESHGYECRLDAATESFTNVAQVVGETTAGTIVSAEDTADLVVIGPAIDIQKTPDLQTLPSGSDVIFDLTVTNIGDVDLTDVTVTDAIAPICDRVIGTLAAGQSTSYSCQVNNVTADFINIAKVVGRSPLGTILEDEDDAAVEIDTVVEIHPSIVISKTPDLQTVIKDGPVDFTISIWNNGDVALTDVIVTDPQVPACDQNIGTLAVGETTAYSCRLNAANADFTNVAIVSGMPPVGEAVTAQDSANVDVISPVLSIEKLPDMQMVRVDGTAHFTIVVKNSGDTPLFEVAVTDELSASCNRLLGDLLPGDSRTYHCEAPNVKGDFVNVAVVQGNTVLDTQLSDSDNAVVDLISPALAITKSAAKESIGLGETAEFTIRVVNEGDVTLTNVTVADQQAPDCTRTLGLLQPGDAREYTCEMPNVRETVVNVAIVTGTPPVGPEVMAEDNARVEVPKAKMTLSKQDNLETAQPGGAIAYTLTYANVGPGDAFDVVLIEVVPSHTTFDAANSDAGWVCEGGRDLAGTACRYEVGNIAAGSAPQSVIFAVRIDDAVPTSVKKLVNQVTIDGINLSPSGNALALEETPMTATALDVVDEPGIRYSHFVFLPVAQ